MITQWRNKKTGILYCVLEEGFDTTNERDGLPVIIYNRKKDPVTIHQIFLSPWFVREKKEFMEKFEPIREK